MPSLFTLNLFCSFHLWHTGIGILGVVGGGGGGGGGGGDLDIFTSFFWFKMYF